MTKKLLAGHIWKGEVTRKASKTTKYCEQCSGMGRTDTKRVVVGEPWKKRVRHVAHGYQNSGIHSWSISHVSSTMFHVINNILSSCFQQCSAVLSSPCVFPLLHSTIAALTSLSGMPGSSSLLLSVSAH